MVNRGPRKIIDPEVLLNRTLNAINKDMFAIETEFKEKKLDSDGSSRLIAYAKLCIATLELQMKQNRELDPSKLSDKDLEAQARAVLRKVSA